MPTHSTPIYLDPAYLAVAVSVVALFLTQIPPIRILLKKRNLEVALHARIIVDHILGNPHIKSFVDIRNTGGRAVRISRIRLSFRRDGNEPFLLEGRSYAASQSASSANLLVPFDLKPGESWSHMAAFLSDVARNEEKRLRELHGEIRADITQKLRARKEKSNVPEKAAPELANECIEIFNSKFKWEPGEYIVTLEVHTEDSSAPISKAYRFLLFEKDSQFLRDHADHYDEGEGIYFEGDHQDPIFIPLENYVG